MAKSIGEVNWKLVSQYDNQGVALAIADNKKLVAASVESSTTLHAIAVSNSQSMMRGFNANNIRQGAFAMQDFMSQMQNSKTFVDGFGRGIGAITNNLQMMGGPTLAIGAALGGAIVPGVVKWLNNTVELENKTKSLESMYERIAASANKAATVDVRGNREDALKNTKEELEINAKTREASGKFLQDEMSKLGKMEAELKKRTLLDAGPIKLATNGPEFRQLEQERDAQKSLIDKIQTEHQKLVSEQIALTELQNHLNSPNAIAAQEAKDAQKMREERNKAYEDINKKAAEGYGTEMEKTEAKLARERRELVEKGAREGGNILNKFDEMAAVEKQRAEIRDKQRGIRNEIEDLRNLPGGLTPNGPSSASIAGTSGAASAINRALAGTASVENDRRRQIQLLEDQLKTLNRLEQKMNFKRMGLAS